MIGIERVSQTERISGDTESEPERARVAKAEVPGHDEQQQRAEADHVQRQHDRGQAAGAPPLGRGQSVPQARERAHQAPPSAAAFPGARDAPLAPGDVRSAGPRFGVLQSSSVTSPPSMATLRARARPASHSA